MEPVRKIDIHAHAVPDTRLFPRHKATGLPFLSPEQLIQRYDELGIEKIEPSSADRITSVATWTR